MQNTNLLLEVPSATPSLNAGHLSTTKYFNDRQHEKRNYAVRS